MRIMLITLICIFVVSGCVSHAEFARMNSEKVLKDAEVSLSSAKICCEKFSDMKFDELRVNEKIKKYIGPERMNYGIPPSHDSLASYVKEPEKSYEQLHGIAYEFTSGKSFFRAFSLPSFKKNNLIKVQSRAIGAGGIGAVFYPVLLFLDEDFNVVRRYVENDLELKQGSMWYFIEAITAIREDEKYLIICTDKSMHNETLSLYKDPTIMPVVASGGMYFIPMPSITREIPFSMEGIVDIKVEADKS